jgi:hypothetical protein
MFLIDSETATYAPDTETMRTCISVGADSRIRKANTPERSTRPELPTSNSQ